VVVGKHARTPSEAMVVSGSAAAGGRRSKRHHVWVAVAALLAVGGIVGAVFAAGSVARNDTEKSRQAFEASSGEIASTLQLAIQHEEDLVVNASAFMVENPHASNAKFRQWLSAVQAFERYPELGGLGNVALVSASELPAFVVRAVGDPVGPLGPGGRFQLIPPGDRPYYCLGVLGVSRDAATAVPAGFDFCADPTLGQANLAARDSGQSSYRPLKIAKGITWLGMQVPIYRGGLPPATVEARRDAFLGWVGTGLDPKVVLDVALRGHAGTAAAFRFRDAFSDVVFRSGKVPAGTQSVTINLQNGWTVRTFAMIAAGGMFANGNALALLIAGVVLSIVLGMLVFVLATGRARALRLVGERTGELRHQALHDALTGLPNRTLIMDRIEQLLARNRRNGTVGAALYIDLDEFKNVNDSLGHEAGDRLLVAVAARLTSTLRDADTVGRMGGDEFVVLIDGGELKVGPELVAERLLDVMRQPFELDGAAMPLIVNTSIGIAIGDRASPGDLVRDADVALYEAKAAGKNRYEIFYPEMQIEISHRIELEFDLRSALEGDQFRLVYQPIYNLDDLTLVGVEALLRWVHPTQGLMQPDEFIPILEQTGQIREVGSWVLSQACEQMAAWHAQGDALVISVNVSGRQLDSDAIVGHIRDALDSSGLDATSLILEVTETALMRNAEATVERLQAIKALGVRIAVDDFGTGYSSLAYLQRFPVDCLKIDRSFTHAITTSPESKALISTLVQLGKDLGLTTLAEGVETADQIDHLRGESVNEAQGFIFSRPLDAEALETQILAPTRPGAQTGKPR
jgi:diguanylate cyclase (GGDEF)-like protein